ncbi:MAG: hypothetical protein JRI41_01935 [Deltaproteobacteria bacterium]|nr:hypothetical protein [Deltaproteobacteria bacterium]
MTNHKYFRHLWTPASMGVTALETFYETVKVDNLVKGHRRSERVGMRAIVCDFYCTTYATEQASGGGFICLCLTAAILSAPMGI